MGNFEGDCYRYDLLLWLNNGTGQNAHHIPRPKKGTKISLSHLSSQSYQEDKASLLKPHRPLSLFEQHKAYHLLRLFSLTPVP